MNNIDGAILFRCGDSRNGGMYKALKRHYGWLPYCRIKTIALAGGAHTNNPPRLILEEARIYTKALMENGATRVALIITEHDYCKYVELRGKKKIKERWMNQKLTNKFFDSIPELDTVALMNIGYCSHEKATVPSNEVVLTELFAVSRDFQLLKAA